MNRRGLLGALLAFPVLRAAAPAAAVVTGLFAPRGGVQDLVMALEAGSYAGPLVSGQALQIEDLSPVMRVVTFEDRKLRLLPRLADAGWRFTRTFT